MSFDVGRIRDCAVRMRAAIERSSVRERPITLQGFPSGACGDASLLLGAYLADSGVTGFEYQSGTFGSKVDGTWFSHAWLVKEKLTLDITADQFDLGFPSVLLSESEGWYLQFELDGRMPADFRQWSGNGIGELAIFYAKIFPNLSLM